MAIETTAVVINDLNPEYPFSKDYISEGAGHLKLIKQVVKNTFPTASTPLTTELTYLNRMPDYLDFSSTTTGGTTVKTIDAKNSRIINVAAGTGDNDLTGLKQVRDLITQAFRNIFDVGSYWCTDSNANPATVFGFGTWQRITGMLMGAGTVYPDGSIPNQSARTFVVGEKGGSFSKAIKEENIPQIQSDFSKNGIKTANAGSHQHRAGVESVFNSGSNYRLRNVPGGATFIDGSGVTDSAGDHSHQLEGILKIGRPIETLVPMDVMNPYQVTNIWKRIS